MGMYTELALAVQISPDAPRWFVETLVGMAEGFGPANPGQEPEPDPDCPDHPLFHTSRWWWMLRSGGSGYFHMAPMSRWTPADELSPAGLTVWTNIKNYDNEWGHFLDWIAPFIKNDREHIGHIRYEECDHPDLLYAMGDRIVRVPPSEAAAIDLWDEETWPKK